MTSMSVISVNHSTIPPQMMPSHVDLMGMLQTTSMDSAIFSGSHDDKKDKDHQKSPNTSKQPAKNDDKKRKDELRTQMIGESAGDDLGYDPRIIPTSPIED